MRYEANHVLKRWWLRWYQKCRIKKSERSSAVGIKEG